MKANVIAGAAVLLSVGMAGGCATTSRAVSEAKPVALADCRNVTGSRIRGRERGDCTPFGYPSRSFSAEELQATGEIDLADALRQLDPAFR